MPGDRGRTVSEGDDRARARHHLLFIVLVAVAALAATGIFVNDWQQRDWLSRKWLYRSPTGLVSVGILAAVSVASLSFLGLAWRAGRWRSTSYAPLRWTVPVLFAGWVLLWSLEPPTLVYDVQQALAGAAAAWSASVALVATRSDRPWPRWVRILDVLACEVAACAFLVEGALRLVRRTAEVPMLATASTGPDAWIRTYRLAPGRFHYGFRVNREGYPDAEPEDAARHAHVVACIGDSFSVGVVPHHLHYTTIAEGAFEDLEVYNIGVVNSGPREYLRLLESSALPLRPGLIVVALFLGNDLTDATRGDPTTLSTWTDRHEILLLQLARRLSALWGERRAGATIADPGAAAGTQGLTGDAARSPAEIERLMPWFQDPLQELPALSPPRFAYVESTRAEVLLDAPDSSWEELFEFLERIRAAAGAVPVACLLIPDEFQVEDALWEQVRAKVGLETADRDRPQALLRGWLEERGIACLDLLPILRAVPPLPDGDRHLYHLRDTHFNARGNRIVGAALAELIEREGLARRTRATDGLAPR